MLTLLFAKLFRLKAGLWQPRARHRPMRGTTRRR